MWHFRCKSLGSPNERVPKPPLKQWVLYIDRMCNKGKGITCVLRLISPLVGKQLPKITVKKTLCFHDETKEKSVRAFETFPCKIQCCFAYQMLINIIITVTGDVITRNVIYSYFQERFLAASFVNIWEITRRSLFVERIILTTVFADAAISTTKSTVSLPKMKGTLKRITPTNIHSL